MEEFGCPPTHGFDLVKFWWVASSFPVCRPLRERAISWVCKSCKPLAGQGRKVLVKQTPNLMPVTRASLQTPQGWLTRSAQGECRGQRHSPGATHLPTSELLSCGWWGGLPPASASVSPSWGWAEPAPSDHTVVSGWEDSVCAGWHRQPHTCQVPGESEREGDTANVKHSDRDTGTNTVVSGFLSVFCFLTFRFCIFRPFFCIHEDLTSLKWSWDHYVLPVLAQKALKKAWPRDQTTCTEVLSPFVHSHYSAMCLLCCGLIDYSLAVKYPPTCCWNYADRSELK